MSHIVSSVIKNECVSFIKFLLPELFCCFFQHSDTESAGRRGGLAAKKMTYETTYLNLQKKPTPFTKILQQYLVCFQSDPLQLVGPIFIGQNQLGFWRDWGSDSAQLQREVLGDQMIVVKNNDDVDFKFWKEINITTRTEAPWDYS